MLQSLEDLDRDYVVRDRKQLFGTPTRSSFTALMSELTIPNEPSVYFLDFGSGLGHVVFYMHDMYPNVTCIGVEYDRELYEEAERRKKILGKKDVTFIEKDITKIQHLSELLLNDTTYVILFSFDAVFPLDVVLHIKEKCVDTYEDKITWISSRHESGNPIVMDHRMYIASAGVNENDPGVLAVSGTTTRDDMFLEEGDVLSAEVNVRDVLNAEEQKRYFEKRTKTRVQLWVALSWMKEPPAPDKIINYFIMYRRDKYICIECNASNVEWSDGTFFYCGLQCHRKLNNYYC